MADAARCQVPAIRGRIRRVTGITAIVRAHARGNRQGYAAPQRARMTTDATVLRARAAGHMLRVIELHVKALVELVRESFARRIVAVDALMTDRTHRQRRRGELRQVATGARFVSWEVRSRRVISPAMTFVASDRRVL